MATKNFIPPANGQFSPWQNNFVSKVNSFKGGWNWAPETATEWDLLSATAGKKKKKYDDAWEVVSSGVFTKGDEQRLKDARKDYESGDKKNPEDTSIRMFINRYIRYNPLVTNDQKLEMGMTVPDDIKSPTSDPNASISGLVLEGKVKEIRHLVHTSLVTVAGQINRGKPDGVDAIEVFIAFTDNSVKTPPDINAFAFAGDVKRGLFTITFSPEQEGKRAWYYARIRVKGKNPVFGPPSETWNSVIA